MLRTWAAIKKKELQLPIFLCGLKLFCGSFEKFQFLILSHAIIRKNKFALDKKL